MAGPVRAPQSLGAERDQRSGPLGADYLIRYKTPGPVAADFMLSDKFVRGLRGPVGSGKTSACCIEMFRRMAEQAPDREGWRPSRWVVLRNTQPELKTTTIKSWLDWFPETKFGQFSWQPPFTHRFKVGNPYFIETEVIFLALDNDEDVRKLYSLEVTGAWINEARFIPKAVLDVLGERVWRFPSRKRVLPSWGGIIMDTNAMEPDHWWPIMAGETPIPSDMAPEEALMLRKPKDWAFWSQPGAMIEEKDESGRSTGWKLNPVAENVVNLPENYYERAIQGKTRSHILRNIANQLVPEKEGRTVYPSFSETLHLASLPLPVIPRLPVWVGLDFGLTPAAVFAQNLRGQWLFQREIVTTSMGAVRMAQAVKQLLAETYPAAEVHAWGDPAGDHRAETDENTPFRIFHAAGLKVRPAPTNDFDLRREAVEEAFRRTVEGRMGVLIDPSMRHLKKALLGGYFFAKVGREGSMRWSDRPVKNESSHVADAMQYLMLGAGEGRAVLVGARRKSKKKPSLRHQVFDRMARAPGLRDNP
jgi:hypothetical protein